jgi:hypothetical protein
LVGVEGVDTKSWLIEEGDSVIRGGAGSVTKVVAGRWLVAEDTELGGLYEDSEMTEGDVGTTEVDGAPDGGGEYVIEKAEKAG